MGAEMDVIFVVLVCLCLIVLMFAVYWQNKTIAELSSWIDMMERRLDKVQEYASAIRVRVLDIDRAVGQLQAKVEYLEKEIKR